MDKMDKTVESVRRNFGTVRTGRANVSMLDRIEVRLLQVLLLLMSAGGSAGSGVRAWVCLLALPSSEGVADRPHPAPPARQVDYYGAMTPLKTIAGVSTPEATMLVIQPFDISAVPAIERAIMASDLGLTPSNDGRIIRLSVPQLTSVSCLAWSSRARSSASSLQGLTGSVLPEHLPDSSPLLCSSATLQERRKEMTKIVAKLSEEGKVAVR